MKVVPQGTPTGQTPAGPTPAQDARARAIAKLTQNNQPAVPDQNNISPEEIGAVKASSSEGQVSETEAPKAATEEPKQEESPISSQYAVLARKEKAFRAKVAAEQQALKAEREALEKTKAEYAAKDAEYQSKYIPKERLTEDTINVLLENGLSYDQITQMMLNQSTAHQDPVLKAQLADLKAQIAEQKAATLEAKKAVQDAQTSQYIEAVKQITRDTEQLVRTDPNFEAIRETNSVKDVVDLIEKTFKEDGILLSVEEAAKEVEDELVSQLSKYAQKIKKLQQKFAPQSKAAPQQPVNNKTAGQQQQPGKTLTNSMGASRPLSTRERAILAFENKLSK